MSGSIRVAQVVGRMKNGGVENTIMNHYRHINHEVVQFDFIAQDDSTQIPFKEIENLGGRVFLVPSYKHIISYIAKCKAIFREIQPDIVHSNMNALSVFPLLAAKRAGVQIRIAHSHSTANPHEMIKTIVKKLLRPLSKIYPTNFAACSDHASRWLFGNKIADEGRAFIMKNAIDPECFTFDETRRSLIREELGLSDNQLVIGQVGRLSAQKNQLFTLQVFKQVLRSRPDALLVLIGDEDGLNISEKIRDVGIEKNVRLLGVRQDVASFYSAFDVLIFPSLYEGLGMVCVEAQAADLHVIASDRVPTEADIVPGLVQHLSLDKGINAWSNALLKTADQQKGIARVSRKSEIVQAGYDIDESADELAKWYVQLVAQPRKGQVKNE